MKSIYRSQAAKQACWALYDQQLQKLGCPYEDVYLDTGFGRTHLVKTGACGGPPLLVFHGGNSTSAYNLLLVRFLLRDFCVYAVDIIGHPGKSAETSLPPYGYAYGEWAAQVADALGFGPIRCFGGSFGAGVLAKLMCTAPQKVKRCVLEVPSGISNAFPVSSVRMLLPLLRYRRTGEEKYLVDTALFMALTRDVLDRDTLDVLKDSFAHVKTKVGMPTNVSAARMGRCTAPTLVLAAERDCLFPARKVLPRAKKILPCCTCYELKGRGHMHQLSREEQERIVCFLKGE